MGKVRSFGIEDGERIGPYRVLENMGRGWEGEVYKVVEVPTDAVRALKLFRTDELDSIRHLIHTAWYYEQLRWTQHVPIYHHYGQWFLDDDNGCWFLVFEFIDGVPLSALKRPTAKDFLKLARAVATVHGAGYGVGDFSSLTNAFVRKSNGAIVFVDCDPGEPDAPNADFREDCLVELPDAANAMFGEALPKKVARLLAGLKAHKRFNETTLAEELSRLAV